MSCRRNVCLKKSANSGELNYLVMSSDVAILLLKKEKNAKKCTFLKFFCTSNFIVWSVIYIRDFHSHKINYVMSPVIRDHNYC